MTPSQVLDCYQERIQYAWPSQVSTVFVGTILILTPKTVKLNLTFLFRESLNPTGMHIVDCYCTPNHHREVHIRIIRHFYMYGISWSPVIGEVLV